MTREFCIATGLKQTPIDTVRLPITLILKVISAVTDGQMAGIDTATVMATVADYLIAGGGKPVGYAVDEPISAILMLAKPKFSWLLRLGDHTSVSIYFRVSQQVFHAP
nr:hypothetical protein [Ruegeria sp. HKCCA0235A]